jgi:hypothetical protein
LRFRALARLPRVRVVFFCFARRTALANSSRDWGRFQQPQQQRVAALRDLIVVAFLIARSGRKAWSG